MILDFVVSSVERLPILDFRLEINDSAKIQNLKS